MVEVFFSMVIVNGHRRVSSEGKSYPASRAKGMTFQDGGEGTGEGY